MRKFRFRLSTLLLPILSLLTCEFVLWVSGFPDWWSENALLGLPEYLVSDELTGWNTKPGIYNYFDYARKKEIVITFRQDHDRSCKVQHAAEGALVILGDSYVMGYGVSDDDTFACLLQKQLTQKHVINLGVGGFGTCHVIEQSGPLISSLPKDKGPITAVYLFNTFHAERNIGSPLSVRIGDRAAEKFTCKGELDSSGGFSIVKSVIEPRWTASRYLRSAALLDELIRVIYVWFHTDEAKTLTRRMLSRLSSMWRDFGASFKVALFDATVTEVQQYSTWLKEDNIDFIDCSQVLRDSTDARLADGHPNELSHAKLAECIAHNL